MLERYCSIPCPDPGRVPAPKRSDAVQGSSGQALMWLCRSVQGRRMVPGKYFSPWLCDGSVTPSSLLSVLCKESLSLLCQGRFLTVGFPASFRVLQKMVKPLEASAAPWFLMGLFCAPCNVRSPTGRDGWMVVSFIQQELGWQRKKLKKKVFQLAIEIVR